MDGIILISIILFWLFLLLTFVNIYLYSKEKESLNLHLHEIIVAKQNVMSMRKSIDERVIRFLTHYADDFSTLGERINFSSETADIETLLQKSGNPYRLTTSEFQGMKIVSAIIGFGIGVIFFFLGLPFANVAVIAMPIVGFLAPIYLLKRTARNRQSLLRRDLPDFLDTMSISLQAGSGLDHSIKEIIPYYPGPIEEEFSRLLSEIDLGLPREIAYQQLLNRNDNEDFQYFIKALVQATRLGVPISRTFKEQANEIRAITLEQVKEQAAKASPKVTLVITFIIAPLIMLMVLGLVILNMIYGENSIVNLFNQ